MRDQCVGDVQDRDTKIKIGYGRPIPSVGSPRINDIADKLDQLPAGGVIGEILLISFLVFVILLITDIAGYTDIFPFVKKK